jgi:hypothetical protein
VKRDVVQMPSVNVHRPNCGKVSRPKPRPVGPKKVCKQAINKDTKKKRRGCKHEWVTVQSFGAMGFRARCSKCGDVGTFMART